MTRLTKFIAFLSLVATATTISAADWPQFLGPNRNGSSPETGLLASWSSEGPKVLWKVPGGPGYSQIVVGGGRAFTIVERDKGEVVLALEIASGKEVWSHRLSGSGASGSTPAFQDDRLYVQSMHGALACLAADSGKVVWQHDLVKLFPANQRAGWAHYGMMTSPLIEGDLVLTAPGRKGAGVAAFHKTTGKVVWQKTDDNPSFPSPVILHVGGQKQALFVTGIGVLAVQPEDGKELWRFPWEDFGDAVVPTPLVIGERIFLSSGPLGCTLLAPATSGNPKVVWKSGQSRIMENYWATAVYHDQHLYGISGGFGSKPSLNCVEAATGKLVWSEEKFGWASITLADGNLYILTISGDLVVAPATSRGYEEKGRCKVLEPARYVNAPTIAGRKIYVRDGKSIVCLDIGGREGW